MTKEVFAEVSRENQLSITSEVQASLVQLKLGAGAFAVDEKIALSNQAYLLVQRLKAVTGA